LFNWGGGGSKASSDIGAGSSSSSSGTNTSSKQQLEKIRSALAPLKLRLAILLADFGLTKEAAEYAKGIRAIVIEAETGVECKIFAILYINESGEECVIKSTFICSRRCGGRCKARLLQEQKPAPNFLVLIDGETF